MQNTELHDTIAALRARIAELERLVATHARTTARQASLDRIRSAVAEMRSADDFQGVTPLVWRELKALGVPFFRCGVFIMDETTETVHAYLSNPDGAPLAVLKLPFDGPDLTADAVDHWRRGAVYRDVWDREHFVAWTRSILEAGFLHTPIAYQGGDAPPETLALQFVPFSQGLLYVGSAEPLTDGQIDLVRSLAGAFAIAYARYEDFRRLQVARGGQQAARDEVQATRQQLIRAEKMASLGEMTAGIAHEIKNPLNFVNNFSEIIVELVAELAEELERNPDASLRDVADDFGMILADLKVNAEQIVKHGKRADGIVRAMMQHARGGSGEREPIEINAFVHEYVALAYHGKRAQMEGFNATIEETYGDDVGRASIVPQDMGRVLLNLLGNAFDAVHQRQQTNRPAAYPVPPGEGTGERHAQGNAAYEPTVYISTQRTDNRVEISVCDNGTGIPDSARDRIFEPFFTTKPTGAGTGLGLALSHDIVTKDHGGTLTVTDTPGGGATFTITVPV